MRFSIAYPAFAILALLSPTVTSMPTPDVDRATRNQRLTQDSIADIKERKAQNPSLRITIGFKPPPLYSYPTPKANRDAETRVKDDLEHPFGSTHDFVFDPDLKYPFSIVYKTIQYTLSLKEGSKTLAEFQVASSRTTPKKVGDQPIVVVVMSPVDDKEHHRWPDSNDCEEQEQLQVLGLASPIRSGMQREQ
ncbi:hypothetical protein FB446DRAFT_753984 [Lentinula raphanica]|nr:hypothetical protein FB446DRAFT_753984 [Lentinula raphanica]